jgi:hypothetical protein
MRNWMIQAVRWLLVVSLIPFLSGCQSLKEACTGQLWISDHYEPATNANVGLFQPPNHSDVLVQYDEQRKKDGLIECRAYMLLANEHKVEAQKKPDFIPAGLADKMEPIPVESADSTNTPTASVWAKLSPDGQQVMVYREGYVAVVYPLPKYDAYKASRRKRILWAPVIVTEGVLVIAIYAAAYGAPALQCIH